jgi:hypothetical protein
MVSGALSNKKASFIFNGKITVVSSSEEDARAESILTTASVLGFDLEYVAYVPPVPQGPLGKNVATIQLLKDDAECFIWRPHLHGYSPGLVRLLQNPNLIKVASNVKSDATRLAKDDIRLKGGVDVIAAVKASKLQQPLLKHDLASLVRHPHILDPLPQRHLSYAATDALAHLSIYNKVVAPPSSLQLQPLYESRFLWSLPPTTEVQVATTHVGNNSSGSSSSSSSSSRNSESSESTRTNNTSYVSSSEVSAASSSSSSCFSGPAFSSSSSSSSSGVETLQILLDREMGRQTMLEIDEEAYQTVISVTAASTSTEDESSESQLTKPRMPATAMGAGVELYFSAQKAIIRYADGEDPRPYHLPPGIPRELRKDLHAFAAHHGLVSESSDNTSPSGGGGDDRHIVISRWHSPAVVVQRDGKGLVVCQGARGGTNGQTPMDRWQVVKFDPIDGGIWTAKYGNGETVELGVAELNRGMRRRHMEDMIAVGADGVGALSFKEGTVGGFTSEETERMAELINPKAEEVIEKVDIFHWMADVMSKCVKNKHSPVFPFFANALSDAIFTIMAGERERRIKHFVKLGMDPTAISQLRRRHFRPFCRYVVGAEDGLLRRLVSVFNLFVELPDPSRANTRFMTSTAKSDFKSKLRYVLCGWMSDPRSLAMYFQSKVLPTTKFVIYKCLRSTSQTEGYHAIMRQILCVGSISCGERWLQAVSRFFDHRWNVRILIELGFLRRMGHFSPEISDLLSDLVAELKNTNIAGSSFTVPELESHVRTPSGIPVVPCGFFPAEPRDTPLPPMGPRTNLDTWYKETMGEQRRTTWTDVSDVAAVLEQPNLMLRGDAKGIEEKTGVSSTTAALVEKARAIAGMEVVFGELQGHGSEATFQNIRTPCPLAAPNVPTPARPVQGAAPSSLPIGPASSNLTSAAAASLPNESNQLLQQQPSGQFADQAISTPKARKSVMMKQLRDKRKRLRERQEGTTEEQEQEIARHTAENTKRMQSKKAKSQASLEDGLVDSDDGF